MPVLAFKLCLSLIFPPTGFVLAGIKIVEVIILIAFGTRSCCRTILRLHWMNEMQTVATDVRGVCPSVCLL